MYTKHRFLFSKMRFVCKIFLLSIPTVRVVHMDKITKVPYKCYERKYNSLNLELLDSNVNEINYNIQINQWSIFIITNNINNNYKTYVIS